MTTAADELEATRQLKARYCRFQDTKDVESWRGVFTTDVVVTLAMCPARNGCTRVIRAEYPNTGAAATKSRPADTPGPNWLSG